MLKNHLAVGLHKFIKARVGHTHKFSNELERTHRKICRKFIYFHSTLLAYILLLLQVALFLCDVLALLHSP